ncbi:MAG: hypothetical protein E6Q97_12445 [Desulfurellales bacterium]|nr:MAG: hypothetical protein E6Q97_12445 [Desulfurellales bacterium]
MRYHDGVMYQDRITDAVDITGGERCLRWFPSAGATMAFGRWRGPYPNSLPALRRSRFFARAGYPMLIFPLGWAR